MAGRNRRRRRLQGGLAAAVALVIVALGSPSAVAHRAAGGPIITGGSYNSAKQEVTVTITLPPDGGVDDLQLHAVFCTGSSCPYEGLTNWPIDNHSATSVTEQVGPSPSGTWYAVVHGYCTACDTTYSNTFAIAAVAAATTTTSTTTPTPAPTTTTTTTTTQPAPTTTPSNPNGSVTPFTIPQIPASNGSAACELARATLGRAIADAKGWNDILANLSLPKNKRAAAEAAVKEGQSALAGMASAATNLCGNATVEEANYGAVPHDNGKPACRTLRNKILYDNEFLRRLYANKSFTNASDPSKWVRVQQIDTQIQRLKSELASIGPQAQKACA